MTELTASLLPDFKYHPDPVSTGSIRASPAACDCCGRSQGFEYIAPFYSKLRERPTLCPWCIASGEAAKKYGGKFSDSHPLRSAGIAKEIIREVCERTPGYISWQQESWQSHCRDACEFHGDAEPAELRDLSERALTILLNQNRMEERHWRSFLEAYQPGGELAVYKFVCRHCREAVYSLDMA